MAATRIIMGIDPGLAHTGWGVVHHDRINEQCRNRSSQKRNHRTAPLSQETE